MNYKLVQRLKKAGFPFDFKESKMGDDTYTYPSLEELIEACGDMGNETLSVAVANLWLKLNE